MREMKRILIIDDDVTIRITLTKLLSKQYILKQARNVKDAIDKLKTEIYNLVVLDLRLPPVGWKGGFQILQKKKNIPLNAATPVIIISGAKDEEFIQKKISTSYNVAKILIKPVENDVILKEIGQVLGNLQSQK